MSQRMHPLHPHSPWRIFTFSAVVTVASLVAILLGMGLEALTVAIILITVEIAFSFDNAIINAKVLAKMSPFWQKMFLTVGAVIAIFGMRAVFPIFIVALTADLSWSSVLDLALNHPAKYAHELEAAHPSISAFGGAFLLLLALDFFVDSEHQVVWFTKFERNMQKLATHWAPIIITVAVIAGTALLPMNEHARETVTAGLLGVVVYTVLHGMTELMSRYEAKKAQSIKQATGLMAFMLFVYLEVLDASFSFDGVIGAFAITNEVVLIAAGLGVGALWVRSLTIYMVRRGTLGNYKYIEHGAHYTIAILAVLLFASIMYHVPEVIVGLTGIGIIVASIIASREAMSDKEKGLRA